MGLMIVAITENRLKLIYNEASKRNEDKEREGGRRGW